ncbi:UDP-4-amino-4,6-dideoxy-N-acetyl-beta-L-altrosamine N-acetyltransferase [Thalassobacillus hwangdonensis]|uniref:UDP-4-amino-4, 6-dideoxy-N-acetyl-beta-L-altrosamine N-acetyltransferase n=1 Tax=Thalassobacillus hwangdonensis TaxID=546108 RepID=A0ABW3KZQ1_9BACI
MFEGERITLRKITMDDAETYHRWRNDPEVMQSTSPTLDTYTLEDTKAFIEMISTSAQSKSYLIEAKEGGQPIGVVSLINIDYKNRNAECIIDIGEKEWWGKGIGKEAMNLLLHYAFAELNLHKVHLKVFSFNYRAIKLYEKLGFTKEGTWKDHLFRDGKWHDVVLMGTFQNDYLKSDDK